MADHVSRRALWMQKLAGEVVRSLCERIRSGDLVAGARLPDAAELGAEFVTSEGVVLRAFEELHEAGLVAPEDGGWVVTGYPGPDDAFSVPVGAQARLQDVIAVTELRVGLEAEAAALAATRRNEAELQAIADAAGAFEAAVRAGEGIARADYAFHLALCGAAGNRYFRDLVDYLGPLLIPRMRVRMTTPGGDRDALIEASIVEHRAIVAAIRARDDVAAREAMRAHLLRTLAVLRRQE